MYQNKLVYQDALSEVAVRALFSISHVEIIQETENSVFPRVYFYFEIHPRDMLKSIHNLMKQDSIYTKIFLVNLHVVWDYPKNNPDMIVKVGVSYRRNNIGYGSTKVELR